MSVPKGCTLGKRLPTVEDIDAAFLSGKIICYREKGGDGSTHLFAKKDVDHPPIVLTRCLTIHDYSRSDLVWSNYDVYELTTIDVDEVV